MNTIKLKDLADNHRYYCSTQNYYHRMDDNTFSTWADFWESYHWDSDKSEDILDEIDQNLVFRWDVMKYDHSEAYYMYLFIINQRKGIFKGLVINRLLEEDLPSVVAYLQYHANYMNDIWNPIKPNNQRC